MGGARSPGAGGMSILSALARSLATALLLAAAASAAEGPVRLFVLREHGVTAVTLAQPYLDRFVALAAAQNGWPTAQGYLPHQPARRGGVHPQGAAPLRDPLAAVVPGAAAAAPPRGDRPRRGVALGRAALPPDQPQRRRTSPAARASPLATDHADDPRFVDRVVAAGQFTPRRLRAPRDASPAPDHPRGDRRPGGLRPDRRRPARGARSTSPAPSDVRPVWSSEELPQMVVAAFPDTPVAEEHHEFRAEPASALRRGGQGDLRRGGHRLARGVQCSPTTRAW